MKKKCVVIFSSIGLILMLLYVFFSTVLMKNAYKRIVEVEKRRDSWKMITQLLIQWIMKKERTVHYLRMMGYHRIGIYGMGDVGKCLVNELKDEDDFSIEFFMDKSVTEDAYGIKSVSIGDDTPDVDVLIVTPFIFIDSVKSELRKHYEFKIVSIEEIVYNA